jgi:cold shock CspA family protein
LGSVDVDVVRTYLFGSYASNYDLRDDDAVQRRLDFFSMLREEYHYEVETFPINFRGRRIRKVDRGPEDDFEPKEKCVDIALATAMLYYAAVPYVYDIAIAVVGDQDFKPVLQHVRRLGKRVAIASAKRSCAPDFSDPRDEARVKDFDLIWLDDLLQRLELKYESHQLHCESPIHRGDRLLWTTFHPRRGQKFYCDECRAEFNRRKQESQYAYAGYRPDDLADGLPESASGERIPNEQMANGRVGEPLFDDAALQNDPYSSPGAAGAEPLRGVVKGRREGRDYAFISAENGRDYYFHQSDFLPSDVASDPTFDELSDGQEVEFEVKREPSRGKAGAARAVRLALAEGETSAEREIESSE